MLTVNNSNFPLSNFLDSKYLSTPNHENLDGNFISTSSLKTNLNSVDNSNFNKIRLDILSSLERYVSKDKFSAFFANSLIIKNIDPSSITLCVTTDFNKKMIEEYYSEVLKNSVYEATQKQLNINLVVNKSEEPRVVKNINPSIAQSNNYKINKASSVKNMSFSINELRPSSEEVLSEMNSRYIQKTKEAKTFHHVIDRKKTFDSFIVGPSNNLAHASAIAVSNKPGEVYSALYIYGGSGLGKTHLLHAIANKILETHPRLRIDITSANDFMSEMIEAFKNKTIVEFRKRYYENVDVLMIDDIHMMTNKASTQNEFFHVFNELQRRKKQLIFTSDKEPKDITGLEDRIKTRLSSSLVVDIQQPDFETRIAILKQKATEENIYLPEDVIELIASNVKTNIRELEGSLIKLIACSSVFNIDIDLATAKEQLRINPDDHKKTVNIETITKTVSKYFNIPVADIRSSARKKEITTARHISMYFSYYIGRSTYVQIGDYFGKRDHTSVMHGVNKIKDLQKKDKDFSKKLYEIETQF